MDDDRASQVLNQLTGGSLGASSSALNGLQTYLAWFFWLGLISTIIITVAFIFHFIHKRHVQAAILRIDKNLQRLVDHQIPVTEEVQVSDSVDENSEQKELEQK